MLEYRVSADRTAPGAATARSPRCPGAVIALDTDPGGRTDAMNPAELLLAAVGACMLKGIERITPMLRFQWRGAHVRVHAIRQDAPPKLLRIDYEISVESDESDRRLELLHTNVRKFGTITNTLAGAVEVTGRLVRAPHVVSPAATAAPAAESVPAGPEADDYR